MKLSKKLIGVVILAVCALIPLSTQSSTKSSDGKEMVVLTSDNVIVLNDEVNGQTVSAVVEAAKKLDAKFSLLGSKKPIYLFLNTPGGSIQAGLELIEQLQALNRPVHTVTLFAASMGFQIAQNLGERYILKNGVLMSHRAHGGFEGSFGGQSPSPIDGIYGLWLSRLNEMDEMTVSRTGNKQTMESYQKAYAPDMWRTGQQSVTEGYADKVVKVSCDKSLKGTTQHTAMYLGIIPIAYDLSECPMNTTPMNVRVNIRTNKGIKTSEEFSSVSGGFGFACLQAAASNPTQVCSLDSNLTFEKFNTAAQDFQNSFEAKSRQVIRMRVGQ